MGLQYTPVDSIATCVQPAACSQSSNCRMPCVVVAKGRIFLCRCPSTIRITHATSSFLWTSIPQQRGESNSISSLIIRNGGCSQGTQGERASPLRACSTSHLGNCDRRWCLG